MKYNINNLYFAKCRHCIMDIINVTDNDGHIMSPHPDYVNYYTILLLRNSEYVNIYHKSIRYKNMSQVDNLEEHYGDDLIIEMFSLSEYIDTEYKKVSTKECELIEDTIQKTKSLKLEYGYKKGINN